MCVSGQLPIDPLTEENHVGSIEEQTEKTLGNMAEVPKAAGSDINRVVKTTVYVTDIGLGDRVNAFYTRFFGEHRPARAIVPNRDLHFAFQVEIEAIAAEIRSPICRRAASVVLCIFTWGHRRTLRRLVRLNIRCILRLTLVKSTRNVGVFTCSIFIV